MYSDTKILVLSYTNHALDQYLEQLLDIGIPQDAILRLGSKYTSRTEPLTVYSQSGSNNFRRSHGSWAIYNMYNSEANEHKHKAMDSFQKIQNQSIGFDHLMGFLEFSDEDNHFYDAFLLPNILSEEDSDMVLVGAHGGKVKRDYLFERWFHGNDAGIFRDFSIDHSAIWSMELSQRQECFNRWRSLILEEGVESLHTTITSFNHCQKRFSEVKSEKLTHMLRAKRIIGCTTTAAAKSMQDLRNASPSILLVEEAGEILESHILTALSSVTKQLVLIGDHKQLRPKVSNYALTVEKGEGYDLNRSLFERLVLSGYPHTTLTKQHRMCPEISALVRHLTYNDLKDDEETLNRPVLRGLRDRVIFFNHNHLELAATEIADRRDEGGKISKKNEFEAAIVLKCLRYVAQQGYGTDKVVILTPYLGQLKLLHDMLKKDNDPVLNDLDSFDLIRAGLISEASARLNKRPIKISTVGEFPFTYAAVTRI
jgi:AAA domain